MAILITSANVCLLVHSLSVLILRTILNRRLKIFVFLFIVVLLAKAALFDNKRARLPRLGFGGDISPTRISFNRAL